MRKVVAFADEFGNNSFDFDKQGSHFIIASVIVNEDELSELQQELDSIRIRYFQTGEIKSSKVAQNNRRRSLILSELCKLNFALYAVVVDKRRLHGEGFKYKKSFYKFLNGLLYKELYRTYPELELKVDEHGGNDFMRGFKKYVIKNHIRDLFSGSEFYVEKSINDLGVQLADFMAGTLGYIYDESKKSDSSSSFLEILSDKLISINHFPKAYSLDEYNYKDTYSEYDDAIANTALKRMFHFIDETIGNSQDNLDRLNFVKLLLLQHQSNHPLKYTTSKEFMRHLNVSRDKDLRKEQFISQIVGPLRDKGLLIASSRDGYKIPTSASDMKSFVRHGKNIVFPLLRRIQECRDSILLATGNEYDILTDSEFLKLRELIDNTKA